MWPLTAIAPVGIVGDELQLQAPGRTITQAKRLALVIRDISEPHSNVTRLAVYGATRSPIQ